MPSLAIAPQERSSMSLTLPPEFERAIRERVGTSNYETAWDVFATCVGAVHRLESPTETLEWSGERQDALFHDGPRAHHERGGPPEFWVPRVLEVAVRQHLETGRYASVEDVLAAFLTALREQEQWEDENVDWLREQIAIGTVEIDRGKGLPGEEAISQIRAELRERFRS